MWDLWWKKWYCDRAFSEFFSCQYLSTVTVNTHVLSEA
jgi:hypothetical protein